VAERHAHPAGLHRRSCRKAEGVSLSYAYPPPMDPRTPWMLLAAGVLVLALAAAWCGLVWAWLAG
jgi:hypothetical protein